MKNKSNKFLIIARTLAIPVLTMMALSWININPVATGIITFFVTAVCLIHAMNDL